MGRTSRIWKQHTRDCRDDAAVRAARRTVDRAARDRPGNYVSQTCSTEEAWLLDICNRRYSPLPLINIRVIVKGFGGYTLSTVYSKFMKMS